jgi:GTPase involved in cell partitioning and DNA repair
MVSDASATSIGRVKNSLIQYEDPKKAVRGLSLLFLGKAAIRRKRKKSARKKYRFFVDNFIMHHRRLHQKNRDVVLDKIRLLETQKNRNKEKALSLEMSQKISTSRIKSSEKIKKHIMREARKKQISISGMSNISRERSKFSVKSL